MMTVCTKPSGTTKEDSKAIPLAEAMRPSNFSDIVGHEETLGPGSMVGAMLGQKKIPNMILWGPPGCGKVHNIYLL